MAMPLTFQQRFYSHLAEGTNYLYRYDVVAFHLLGMDVIEPVRISLEVLIRRHECLRTKIVAIGNESLQEFENPQRFKLRVSASAHSCDDAGELDHQLARFVAEFAEHGYDVNDGRLFKAALFSMSADRHTVVLAFHHFIYDRWSLSMMLSELFFLYQRLVRREAIDDAEPGLQYSQYAAWQMEMHKAGYDENTAYWDRKLAGSAGIRWPLRMRGEESDSVVLEISRDLRESLNADLHALAQRLHTLWSLELLAAYVSVVLKFCGQTDFVVTTIVNDRDREDHAHVAGYLAHPVYLRVQMIGNETFIELLRLLSREYLSALLHRDFGETFIRRSDLFSGTFFQWNPALDSAPNVHGHEWCPEFYSPVNRTQSLPWRLNFTLYVIERNGSVALWGLYRPQFISVPSMENLLGEFERTLERMIMDPTASIVE